MTMPSRQNFIDNNKIQGPLKTNEQIVRMLNMNIVNKNKRIMDFD